VTDWWSSADGVRRAGGVAEEPPLETPLEPQHWMVQYNEHLLMTVQAIHRLNQALMDRLR
jgi:hypothetical protein